MNAQGAVDSLLGRLTTVLVNEAQLLGRVRSDVEFIKDEMESMNALLIHLTEAQHRDHQVRAWMKQIVGLTRDCEGNVELYIHYVGGGHRGGGLLGYLRRVLRFVRTVQVRHKIAMRIQELKVRARDIGDRRQRYGVTMPPSTIGDGDDEPANQENDLWRRAALLHGAEPSLDDKELVRKAIDTMINWLSLEPPPASGEDGRTQVRVFSVLGRELAYDVAKGVYQHPSVASLFSCKTLVKKLSVWDHPQNIVAGILNEITGQKENQGSKLQGHIKGKRFLIIFTYVYGKRHWKNILDALFHAADGCHPGSVIIIATPEDQVALWCSPYKIINTRSVTEFYINKAGKLNANYGHEIIQLLRHSSTFAMKMCLHLLYANPVMTEYERHMYSSAISKCMRLNKSTDTEMVMFCYHELPSKYRTCLLYLAIFPQGHVIKTTSLSRRWIAEGLVTTITRNHETESAVDEAERYLDVLFTRGFISPVEISAAGNIKSCTLHHEVQKAISKIARDVNIVDTILPPDLAHHLSIHNRIQLQKPHSGGDNKHIATSLPYLAASPQWQLLKVLDLECCKALNKQHLKIICKILLLKYLSLRNTNVTELPKKIKDLRCLETLDVRQTKVRRLARKAIVLPLLKHFLAGHKISGSNNTSRSEELFSTVEVPLLVHRMRNIEILSHVQVSNNDNELASIAELLKLRKLGVALHGKTVKLSELFCQINKLHRSLRSLSIRMNQPAAGENHGSGIKVDGLTPPKFIKSLNISGLTSGLPHLIQDLHQLAKLTLTEAYLKADDLRILGKLESLRYIRLLHNSYTEHELPFKEEEFQSLNYLLIAACDVTQISFVTGAAPRLERIVWSFPSKACLSGVWHLSELKEFELNGDCNPDQVRDEIERHSKFPVFKHNIPPVHW